MVLFERKWSLLNLHILVAHAHSGAGSEQPLDRDDHQRSNEDTPNNIWEHRSRPWNHAGAKQDEKQQHRRFDRHHCQNLPRTSVQAVQHMLPQKVQRSHAVHERAADKEVTFSGQPELTVSDNHPPKKRCTDE
jgi:hypothetical protein